MNSYDESWMKEDSACRWIRDEIEEDDAGGKVDASQPIDGATSNQSFWRNAAAPRSDSVKLAPLTGWGKYSRWRKQDSMTVEPNLAVCRFGKPHL